MRTDNQRPQPTQNPGVARQDIVFGHPSEEEFARVLDFYCIPWRYETTTFPLEWDEDGHIVEAFSPTFTSWTRTRTWSSPRSAPS